MAQFVAPKKKHVSFYRTEGRYNFLNSAEESAQYVFSFPELSHEQHKELGITSSYLVDLEKDYDFSPESYTPIECLQEILAIYEGYWIHTGKTDVKKTIEYLESIEEEQAKLREQYEIDYAEAKVSYWTERLSELKGELTHG